MLDYVMIQEVLDDRINEVGSLVGNNLERAAESSNDIFIDESGSNQSCICSERASLYPFRSIISGDKDVFVAFLGGGADGTYEV